METETELEKIFQSSNQYPAGIGSRKTKIGNGKALWGKSVLVILPTGTRSWRTKHLSTQPVLAKFPSHSRLRSKSSYIVKIGVKRRSQFF